MAHGVIDDAPGPEATDPTSQAARIFDGPGEMRALCRTLDWSRTPLGPVQAWTASLRTTVAALLASRHPMFLFWGPELVQIYNDGYRPSFGEGGRHPRALGMRGREFWTEIWDIIGPQIEAAMTRGEASWNVDHLVAIERNGRIEEVYWTYSYSPVRDDDGTIAGTLVVCQETTARVLAERRLRTLHALGAIGLGGSVREVAGEAMRVLAADEPDIPFALCYLAPDEGPAVPELIGMVGRVAPVPAARWPLETALRAERPMVVDIAGWSEVHDAGPWPEPPTAALVLPITACDAARCTGALVAGLSPRLPLNEAYEEFLRAAAARLGSHITTLRAQQALAASEARHERERAKLEAVLAVVPVGIGIASDPECRDIRVNPAFAAQLGIDPTANASKTGAEASGLPFVVRQGGEEVPSGQLPMQRAARDGVTIRDAEYAVVHRHGRVVRLLEYAAPLYDESGSIRGAVGAFVDVTERAELLAREREARAEAEAASRAKSEFLAVMSHELRTPLNAIGGYAELMELGIHGPLTAEQRRALARIQASQRHLLGLINEVLNYTRVEAGAVQYELAPVPVAEALATCEALTAPQIRAKGLTYDGGRCDPALVVHADREKLQQILLNLLSNAIKFTEPGGRIAIDAEPSSGAVAIRVADTGRGIPASRLEHVFEPFIQVDARLSRNQEGVGLGLAISRDLARGMGGDLTVESTEGVGSVFTLTLPPSGTHAAPRA